MNPIEIRELVVRYRQGWRRSPVTAVNGLSLSEDEHEAWENAHRWLFIQYHREERWPSARDVLRIAISRFPKSGYFREALRRNEFITLQRAS